MSSKKKISLEDIFNDDDFGLLESKSRSSNIKSDEHRLIDSFEEINVFIDKTGREPGTATMSEYNLSAKLKSFQQDEKKKRIAKPFDRHHLLGEIELEEGSLDKVLNDGEFDLLDSDKDLSLFQYKHIPKGRDRASAEFIAQRKHIKEEDFASYEKMFQKVHQEIKEGKRRIKPFYNIEKNLRKGGFYLIDGVMLYLEDADLEQTETRLNSGDRTRIDGRTKTIFENGTYSNMLYRSLGKQIQKHGKLITNTDESVNQELFFNAGGVSEEDNRTGWIYVLKSKSPNPEIASIRDLYKIGFSSTPIEKRIKNAKNEATYLYAEVAKVAAYACYNLNARKLEYLLDRFFGSVCLDVDLFSEKGQRITPREWFVVPFEVIDKAIELITEEKITNYVYDAEHRKIRAR